MMESKSESTLRAYLEAADRRALQARLVLLAQALETMLQSLGKEDAQELRNRVERELPQAAYFEIWNEIGQLQGDDTDDKHALTAIRKRLRDAITHLRKEPVDAPLVLPADVVGQPETVIPLRLLRHGNVA